MKISVQQSGGYAGTTETIADVDTSRLDAATARKIEGMVRQRTLAGASGDATPDVVGADLPRFDITIRDQGSSRTISFVDDGSPVAAQLRQFVEELSAAR